MFGREKLSLNIIVALHMGLTTLVIRMDSVNHSHHDDIITLIT